MPLVWTKKAILQSTKNFKYYLDWRTKYPSAYKRAQDIGYIDKIKKILIVKNVFRWNFETIKRAAKKFKTKKEWSIKDKHSYDAARERKLTKNELIVGHFKPTDKTRKWNLKEIVSAAKKFQTRKEWREAYENKECFSYLAARDKKLLNHKLIVGHFRPTDKSRKWTYKNIIASTKNVSSYKEWMDKYPYAYQRAYRTNVLEKVASHLERVGTRYKRCLYSIKIKGKKIIYIGLTFNFKQRIKQHLKKTRFKDLKKIYGENSLIVKKLTDYMDIKKAAKREKQLIKRFKKAGYELINTKKGGDLGSIPTKWTKNQIIESAKNFKTQNEWRKKVPSAYAIAKKKGFLKEAQKYLYVQKEKQRY